jgi:hypothetical protein
MDDVYKCSAHLAVVGVRVLPDNRPLREVNAALNELDACVELPLCLGQFNLKIQQLLEVSEGTQPSFSALTTVERAHKIQQECSIRQVTFLSEIQMKEIKR